MSRHIITKPIGPNPQPGFTLTEVILATGLAAATLLTLVTLLVSGLDMAADSAATTTSAQITRSLLAKAQSADWQQSSGISTAWPDAGVRGELFYFDDQCAPCPSRDAHDVAFTARLDWVEGGTALPGASPNPFARRITIRVAAGARDTEYFDSSENRRSIHTTHTVAASLLPGEGSGA